MPKSPPASIALRQIHRGKWLDFSEQIRILVTFHPSAILRAPDEDARHKMKNLFLRDIKKIATFF